MKVVRRAPDYYVILHAGREVDTPTFKTEADAWGWADEFVDDQMFDGPNTLSEPLTYRTLQ